MHNINLLVQNYYDQDVCFPPQEVCFLPMHHFSILIEFSNWPNQSKLKKMQVESDPVLVKIK